MTITSAKYRPDKVIKLGLRIIISWKIINESKNSMIVSGYAKLSWVSNLLLPGLSNFGFHNLSQSEGDLIAFIRKPVTGSKWCLIE